MAAHLTSGYGRSKGRPPNTPPPIVGKDCLICRSLRCGPKGGTSCVAGHELGNAKTCPSFRSAAVERVNMGGDTGRIMQP